MLPRLALRSSQEEVDKRKAYCLSCENFKKMIKTCSECGCFMPIKWVMNTSVCPIGKW